MRSGSLALVLVAAMAGGIAGRAGAQPRPTARPPKIELGAGLTWMARVPMGNMDATAATPGGGSFRLFSSSATLGAAPGVDARIGVRLTDRLQIEGAGSYGMPRLRTSVANDIEAGAATIMEPTKQLLVEGSVLVSFKPWRADRRRAPFVAGGAGYLRQLHEGATLVQTGPTFHAGGGVKFAMVNRSRTRLKSVGLRLEARALARPGGVALDGRMHLAPALGAGLFLAF